MERKLASVRKVAEIIPIEGADRIEIAKVDGWRCVVKKGETKAGDLVAYCEIDSFLPIRPEFEFLRPSSYKKTELMGEGFRIRTARMRGEISQGLVLTMTQLAEMGIETAGLSEGDDLTEALGIRKFEIPETATGQGTIIGSLGAEVPKTDETRVQNAEEVLKEFAGLEYYVSTKIDGSSHSISIDADGNRHVYGHNYEYADDGKSSFAEFVARNGFFGALAEYAETKGWKTVAVQGEWAGEGIQKNRLKLKKPEWFVFTVVADGERKGLEDMLEVCDAIGATHVPIEERGFDLPSKYPTAEALLARAEGEYPNGGPKEGIVVRPTKPVRSETLGGPLSLKAVSNRYLLKNE